MSTNDSTIDLLLNRMFRERDEAQAEIARLRHLLDKSCGDTPKQIRRGTDLDAVTIAFLNGSLTVKEASRVLRDPEKETEDKIADRITKSVELCKQKIAERSRK